MSATPPPAGPPADGVPQDATSQTVAKRRRWERKFLAELRRSGNHSAAARAAKIDRTVPYKARQDDPDFAAAYADAMEEACDGLELEARRRAHDGVDVPVIYKGRLCGSWVDAEGKEVASDAPGARFVPLVLKEYSDSLLLALLKAHRPERFKDNVKLEHTGTGQGGAIRHDHGGSVSHEHRLDPAALAAFRGDLVAAGLADVLPDGGAQPVDTAPAAPQAAAVPAAQRDDA
ncbi:MAG TPA: hypothetical protein VFW33_05810 [Gemmataceae bacterium]|nr:hypothetical protein [Gemmataceae bacterium]